MFTAQEIDIVTLGSRAVTLQSKNSLHTDKYPCDINGLGERFSKENGKMSSL